MVQEEEKDLVPPVVEDSIQQEQPEDSIELVDDDVELALRAIFDSCQLEDETLRLRHLAIWRQLQLYAKGIFDLFWDDTAHDWRSFSWENDDDDSNQYNRNINIFRGHMESVVSALSVKLPGVEFFPDDADDPLDLETSQGYSEVVNLIQKHNKSPLLLIKALYIFWTQGTVAAYNYYRTDPKFGSVDVPNKVQEKVTSYKLYCPNCGTLMGLVKDTKPTEPVRCEYCGHTELPETTESEETVERIDGYTNSPKGRVAFDFYGPINVKIPFYAKKQEQIGYLIFKEEVHYATLKHQFQEFEDQITEGSPSQDAYERYVRLLPEYVGNVPTCLNTLSCIWIRPWMYWLVPDEDVRAKLFKLFPTGAHYIYAGDVLVAVEDRNLDDNWTISIDPLSDFIHNEPLGKPLVPVQEMRNDLVSLAFQSIEYSIPENFADPRVLDFDKYKQSQALPGMFTAVKKAPDSGTLSDAFFQTTPSRLSEEVQVFGENLDKDGQFVTHDFPSVYGGPSEGSKTAFEYNKSNTAALQALSLAWKRVVDLWTSTMAKAAVEFVNQMKGDEKYVKKESGKFINVWIRKESLSGKIGSVEPESSEMLPQSWEQKWQLIMQMLQMKDPTINSVLLSPDNSGFMKRAVALHDFVIPGEKDRQKQLGEIYDIINGDVSVQVDIDMDNHPVHMTIIKDRMVDTFGVQLFKTNPKAYADIIEHYKQHESAMQPQGQQNVQPPQGQVPSGQQIPPLQGAQ